MKTDYAEADAKNTSEMYNTFHPPEVERRDSLGDRMKSYENATRGYLTPGLPVIIRVDGRAFHTYTKGSQTPFDDKLMHAMDMVAVGLCEGISGAQMAYVQSDEISVLVTDYKSENTQPWFGGNIQKITSVSASLASVEMTMQSRYVFYDANGGQPKPACFDSRVFILPKDEVQHYFVWRQQDWTRNSLQMLARSLYSHRELENKNQAAMHEMCFQKGANWNDLATKYKRGRCVVKKNLPVIIPAGPRAGETILRPKWVVDAEIPIFTADKTYVGDKV